MSKRGVGFLLALTATIALGALIQDYRFDRLLESERTAASNFDQRIRTLERQVDALDVSRRTALSNGQLPADWLDRARTPIAEAEAALATLRSQAADAPALAAFDAATATFAKFRRADSTGNVVPVQQSLAAARDANANRSAANISQLGFLRIAMNAVAVLFTLAVAVYLGRVSTTLGVKAHPSTAQMFRDLPPPVKNGGPVVTNGAPNGAPLAAHAQVPATHRPSANLAAAAELCVDLSKVIDADDVPVLLERTALVLDARGIVVWAIDGAGARLRASLSYGYPDKVLSKLRPLQIDADNVTSLAFRSLQPQMMNGASPTDPAALAIPLLTGGGPVGVMSVELRHNRPHADLLPVARILGAQFSTLIAPSEELTRTAARG